MPTSLELAELQRRIAIYDDETAYRELYLLFYKPLLHFAGSFVPPEAAQEIVSDVFISLWQNRQQLDEVRHLRVYLYVSTKNNAIRWLGARQRSATLMLDEARVQLQSTQQDPEALMITAEMMNRINAAINNLPPRCKLIYKMVREDRLRYKEIAQILDISVKTIDNQLAIALKRIAAVLELDLRAISFPHPPANES
jgi:RNA polymerase sigma-70 factor (ECF subfamily)